MTAPGQKVKGYTRNEVGVLQGTLSQFFGPNNPIRASQIGMNLEGAAVMVYDMKSQDELRYEGPGTYFPPYALSPPIPPAPGVQDGGWADDFSWGC